MNSVSILIPTHNRQELLAKTLDGLKQLIIPQNISVELIIVANACTDQTPAIAEKYCPQMPFPSRIIIEPTPGLSIARNTCMREARHEILAFLDDDVLVDPHWLEGMIDAFISYPADIVGGKVNLWWEAVQRPIWMNPEIESMISALDWGDKVIELHHPGGIIGANFALKRQVFQASDGFNPNLGRIGKKLLSGEEFDFVSRAMEKKFRLFYTPNAHLQHWVAPNRITDEYLNQIAYGNGYSQIILKQRFTFPRIMRSIVGRTYLFLRNSFCEAACRLTHNRNARRLYRLRRLHSLGAMSAIFKRLARN